MKKLCKKTFAAILALAMCFAFAVVGFGCEPQDTTCDHDWVAGKKTDATYDAEGSQEYTCSKCGATKTETLPKLVCTDHDWVAGEKIEPGYTTEGSQAYTCSKCHATKTDNLGKKALPVDATENTVASTDNAALISNIGAIGETSSVEFTLGEGTFNLKNTAGMDTATAGKTIVLNGAGKDKTTYDVVKATGTSGEAGSDYSFQNAKAVVFKNMTVDFGVSEYNGIVRAKTVVFENCKIVGRITYCGSEKALFVNCEFTCESDYNMWIYSGNTMSFEYVNCTFYSKIGKFLNLYIEDGNVTAPATVSVLVDGCTFKGDQQNKAALNIKNVANTTWNITIKGGSLDNVKGWYAMANGVTATSTVTIDGTTVWANGAVK